MLSVAFALIAVGVILLLQHLEVTDLGWAALWPAVLIAWGLGMLLDRLSRRP